MDVQGMDRRHHKQAGARSINDPRAVERNNLRLALATFALQLDAFEARLKTRRADSAGTMTSADPRYCARSHAGCGNGCGCSSESLRIRA
jgi:hypothetical protein